jgi:glycerol-3-phosphate dehydrogenase (NAD(P)+)
MAGELKERVTILGRRGDGHRLLDLLTQGGHEVTMWGAFEQSIERLLQDREQSRLLPGVRVPPDVRLTANDAECFAGATMVLSAIPTQYMRSAWQRLAPHVPEGVPIASVAKGIENDTLLRPTQIIAEALEGEARRREGTGARRAERNALVALSGPNIAAELAKVPAGHGRGGGGGPRRCGARAGGVRHAVVPGLHERRRHRRRAGRRVEERHRHRRRDPRRARRRQQRQGGVVTRGLVEITRLGVALGARAETFGGLAGLGDLITTCVSPEGRNRSVGEQLGKGRRLDDVLAEMNSVAEGVPTTRSLRTLAARHRVEMPITESVYAILFEGKDAIEALTELMTRGPRAEWE